MTEERNEEETQETEVAEDDAEGSRREFLSKAMAGAGALAAAGLVSGILGSEAEAQQLGGVAGAAGPMRAAIKKETVRGSQLQYSSLAKGHSFEISGKELSNVLAREGLMNPELAGMNTRMSLSLIWE